MANELIRYKLISTPTLTTYITRDFGLFDIGISTNLNNIFIGKEYSITKDFSAVAGIEKSLSSKSATAFLKLESNF